MTGSAHHVADILDATADLCRTVQVDDWSAEDFDVVLAGCKVVAVEVVGLAGRIRAAKVNNTPRPVPTKPQPKPQPKPPPPPKPGKGR